MTLVEQQTAKHLMWVQNQLCAEKRHGVVRLVDLRQAEKSLLNDRFGSGKTTPSPT
ncbi:MAG: hypothetical protein V2J55_07910 [Candidatus Competibacteraceae bacterium]|jgi:hypothetical protein|nr:hypothetical protein [Candidatus Competibacteraceae bacterium]